MAISDEQYAPTRDSLHRVAVHLVARARQQATGRFGLRVTPGGFGTPEFGPEPQRVRVGNGVLVVETTAAGASATSRAVAIHGASLAELAQVAGVDLGAELSVGHDTPPLGDIDSPLVCDPVAAAAMADWWTAGARAIDSVLASLGADATPGVPQLWPEHFDLGLDVGVAGSRVNLGASAGDGFHAGPYLYVGPWDAARPGDPDYWNVSFGALLGAEEVVGDVTASALAFFRRGVDLLAGE